MLPGAVKGAYGAQWAALVAIVVVGAAFLHTVHAPGRRAIAARAAQAVAHAGFVDLRVIVGVES